MRATMHDITDKANELICLLGYLPAEVEAWKMMTFDMPPSSEYWEKVLAEVRRMVNDARRFEEGKI